MEEESNNKDAPSEHDLYEDQVEHDADRVVSLIFLDPHEHHDADEHDDSRESACEEGVVVLSVLEQIGKDLLYSALALARQGDGA